MPFAWARIRTDRRLRALWLTALGVTGGTVLLAGSYSKWWGGHALGPRLLTEAAPFIAVLTLPLWTRRRSLPARVRAAAAAAVLFAALTQVFSVWSIRGDNWNAGVQIDWNPAVRWSIRDSQLLATWWPGWYASWKRDPRFFIGSTSADWVRVDLSPAANTRYDSDPFRPDSPGTPIVYDHYAAIDPGRLNGPSALFHFLSKGRLNAVTTCQGGGTRTVPLPDVVASRAHLLLTAGSTRKHTGQPRLVDLVLEHADGFLERRELHLDRDVWDYDPGKRSKPWIPPASTLAGPRTPTSSSGSFSPSSTQRRSGPCGWRISTGPLMPE